MALSYKEWGLTYVEDACLAQGVQQVAQHDSVDHKTRAAGHHQHQRLPQRTHSTQEPLPCIPSMHSMNNHFLRLLSEANGWACKVILAMYCSSKALNAYTRHHPFSLFSCRMRISETEEFRKIEHRNLEAALLRES